MYIGTPLSKSATKVLFLGGGELGKEVVIALQRLGVEVTVVDRYANSPAMQVAHRSHVIDMTNIEALRTVILQERPHYIVPEIEAIATEVLFDFEHQGITIIPNARSVNLTMNRAGIRRLAAEELGLPTSEYKFARNLEELQVACDEIGYPCFIKPVMSSSGKGQSMIQNSNEVEIAWDYANASGRVNKSEVIVESKIDFDFEITLLTVRSYDSSGNIETNFCNPIGHRQVNGDYVESWQPQPMTDKALENAKYIAKTITDNLSGVGLFGVELFISGDDVWFSEVSPRPHDTGMVTLITQQQNEFELHARAILGLPVNTKQREIGASYVIYAGIDGDGLEFHNLEHALSIENSDIRLFGKPEGFTKRRMGVALAFADDIDTARKNAEYISKKIIVKKS